LAAVLDLFNIGMIAWCFSQSITQPISLVQINYFTL